MATNCVQAEGRQLYVAVDSGVVSGDPVKVGTAMTGVAIIDRDSDGKATVDLGGGVYDLKCEAKDDAGNSAIAVGDPIYFVAADTIKLSKKSSGLFFGYALATVSSGSNATINVQCAPGGAPGQLDIPPLSPAEASLLIRNETGGNLVEGDLVYVSGWNETQKRWLVSKADADAAGARSTFIVRATLATATNGQAYKTHRLTGLNTAGSTVGDAVYQSTTAAGWTVTAPTGADDINQIVGRVAVVSATVGEIEFDTSSLNQVTIGTNELQNDAVTNDKLANITRGSVKVGGAANAPTDLAAQTSGQILVGDGTDLLSVAVSGDVTLAASGAVTIGQVVKGTQVANTAAANVIGGVPVIHMVVVPAGTTGDVDVILTHKTRIIDAWLVKTTAAGGGAGTVQVKNGASAISSTMSIDVADKAITRSTEIDDAAHEIAAGGTLRITRTRTASTAEDCIVYVKGLRVA